MSNRVSTKDKILNVLASNKSFNTLTVAQARARFGVENVSARIHELRNEGFAIYTNRKTLADGRKITFYRLGTPSYRFTRHMSAGRTRLACKALWQRHAA